MKPEYVCPETGLVISNIQSYVSKKLKSSDKTADELRMEIYEKSFPVKDILSSYVNDKMGLPSIKSQYGVTYDVILRILRMNGYKLRTMKECAKYSAIRTKNTNLIRYGVDHTFKVAVFKEKRRKTYNEKYGCDNPFKCKWFLEKAEKTYMERYGRSIKEHRSIKSINAWANKTPEEKDKWLNSSLLSKNPQNISKLEELVASALTHNDIKFETQFLIGRNKFDFLIKDVNLLIEINGDFWHANPLFYKEDDFIPRIQKLAKDVWKKDEDKKMLAKSKGYDTMTIWEADIHNCVNINTYILELIINYAESKNKINKESGDS